MSKIKKMVDCPLAVPIIEGEGDSKKEIKTLRLHRPSPGELRGLNLTQVISMDVTAMIKLIPRITTPILSEAQVADLDPFDFGVLAARISDFFTDSPVEGTSSPPT